MACERIVRNEKRKHALQRHSRINSHQARNRPDPKRNARRQLLARPRPARDELFQGGVGREPDGGVCALAHHLSARPFVVHVGQTVLV